MAEKRRRLCVRRTAFRYMPKDARYEESCKKLLMVLMEKAVAEIPRERAAVFWATAGEETLLEFRIIKTKQIKGLN